jgi:hypothetical protein
MRKGIVLYISVKLSFNHGLTKDYQLYNIINTKGEKFSSLISLETPENILNPDF